MTIRNFFRSNISADPTSADDDHQFTRDVIALQDAKADSEHEEDLVQAAREYVPNTEEEKKLVRKIDLYLLPTVFFMYLMSYMDRTNVGNAKVAGMANDLNLSSSDYSITLVVFFIGYVVCEVPSNMILARSRPSIFLPIIMTLWGFVTCMMALINDYKHLIALRVIVGVLESGFAPGILLIFSSWYKKNELSKRFGVYISASILSGAFGGLLAGAITSGLEGVHGIAGWKWLFIVEGAGTAGVAIFAAFFLLDFPANEKKFTIRERDLATLRLIHDNASSGNDDEHLGHLKALRIAISDWRVILFTMAYMVIVGSATLSYFYPTLVEGLGYSGAMIQYMTVPIYAVAFLCNSITSVVLDKITKYRGLVIAGWLTLATICSIIVCSSYNFTVRYVVLIFMAAGIWTCNAMTLAYASSSFAHMNREVKAISLAFLNAMGNLAQIYGAYLFPSKDSPKYLMGFGVISGMSGVGVIIFLIIYVLLKRYPK
ncbi:major facilitator superfamily domain-containing protein [Dipodascopsis uninucleata]